jgi:hypothetical protein
VALGFVCGGALGNLIDRLAFGKVTDFIEVRHVPVFNAADSAISVGVTLLVLWLLFSPSENAGEKGTTEVATEGTPLVASDAAECDPSPSEAGGGQDVRSTS